jgi:hypothetical protein
MRPVERPWQKPENNGIAEPEFAVMYQFELIHYRICALETYLLDTDMARPVYISQHPIVTIVAQARDSVAGFARSGGR